MFPERALDTVMHFWQNITSYVTPYCEKAEHVVEDGVKNYALPPVQNSYNTMMNYVQSTHLFDALLLLNEKVSQKVHCVYDVVVNPEQRQKVFQECVQKLSSLFTLIRDLIVAIFVLPFTLFWTVYTFVLTQLTWVCVIVPQIIKDSINIIKYISNKTFERLGKARNDYSQGKFDFYELLHDTLHGVQSLIIRYIKYFGRQQYLSRFFITFDILGVIQKRKEKIKSTKKSE